MSERARPAAEGGPPLKLRATDAGDLEVVSAALQDAIAPVGDMTWEREARRFVLVVNRFKWEVAESRLPDEPAPVFWRSNCGIEIGNVTGVQVRGFTRKQTARLLDLLAVEAEPDALAFTFADGGALRLKVSAIDLRLQDWGEPWPTQRRPQHRFEDTPESP